MNHERKNHDHSCRSSVTYACRLCCCPRFAVKDRENNAMEYQIRLDEVNQQLVAADRKTEEANKRWTNMGEYAQEREDECSELKARLREVARVVKEEWL